MDLTIPAKTTFLILVALFPQTLPAQSPLAKGEPGRIASAAPNNVLIEGALPALASGNPLPESDSNASTEGAAKAEPTEISSLESTYDNDTHIAIFGGSVTVKDPEFNVICDKLTATLRHDPPAITQEPKSREGKNKKGPPGPANSHSKGGLQSALAESDEGQVVTITQDKVNPDGTIKHSEGHSRKAFYDAKTGDISLYGGKPDMKQDKSLMVAIEDRTVLILNRDGRTRSVGPSKTYIIQTPPVMKAAPDAAAAEH